jgi:ribonuclease J
MEEAVERVIKAIATPGDHIAEVALLKTQIKEGVSRYLYEKTKRRPMVFPVVVEV